MPLLSRRNFLRLICVATLVLYASGAEAEEHLHLKQVALHLQGDQYVLSGGYNVVLTPTLADALHKGVEFNFIQAFEAEHPRHYWFAEGIAVVHRRRQLSYNALLRQYELQSGAQNATFDTLPEALNALGDLTGWAVLKRSQLHKKDLYQLRVRMYLDSSKLPKPLQLNALASERWDMDSGWREWSFTP